MRVFCALLVGGFAVGSFSGCGESAVDPDTDTKSKPLPVAPKSAKPKTVTKAAPAVPVPGEREKLCFQCEGRGTVPCSATGCLGGKVDCAGPCLKLSRGRWEHRQVDGHDPNELWQRFPNGDGSFLFYSQAHVGEVVGMQGGRAVLMGKCEQCGGTTRANCSVCKGQGRQTCEICAGKQVIPQAWTATDNPWLNGQPDLIRLKDGRVLLGKPASNSGSKQLIRTRDGKFVSVEMSDILPKGAMNASPAEVPPSKKAGE
jgi:hypothetical protein